MDPFERDASPNLSMRQKSALKRRITREHNSNFRAGYININEQYLHKTGIRGRKRYFLYCLVVLLFIVAIINALLTTAIIYHMRLSPQHGMEWVEYIPDNNLLRFLGKSVFETIQIYKGGVGSRANKNLYIEGNNNSVVFTDRESSLKTTTLSVDPQKTVLDNVERMSMINSRTGKEMFTTTGNKDLQLEGDITNLRSPEVIVYNLTSRTGVPDLILESFKSHMILAGSEGVHMTSEEKSINLFTKQDIKIHSTEGSLILDAVSGVRFDMENFPRVNGSTTQGPLTYKLCVCIPNGRLFAVPITGPGIGCLNANPKEDPCQ